MVESQTESFNRDLSANLWWLKNAQHVTFTEKWVMYKEKHVLGFVWFYGMSTIVG